MRPLSCTVLSSLLLAVCLFWMTALPASAQSPAAQPVINPAIEKALLAEDWKQVSDLIGEIKPEMPTVLRFLKGHACLGLNRNNESIFLFATGGGEDNGYFAWQRWADAFAGEHVDAVIALYFQGDAAARNQRWQDAFAAFDKAIALHPAKHHALTLNARGTTYAVIEDWDKAIGDLSTASAVEPKLAAPYYTLGAMWLHKKQGARGALTAFEKACKANRDHAFALYGRACAKYLMGDVEGAKADLAEVKKIKGPHEPLLVAAALSLSTADEATTEQETAQLSLAAKTPIDAKIERLNREGPGGIGGALNDIAGKMSDPRTTDAERKQLQGGVMEYAKKNPGPVLSQLENQRSWNGLLQNFLSLGGIDQKTGKDVTTTLNLENSAKLGVNVGITKGLGIEIGGGPSLGLRRSETVRSETKVPDFFARSYERRETLIGNSGQLMDMIKQTVPAAKGFDTGPVSPRWDDGQWPFEVPYDTGYYQKPVRGK